MTPVVVVHGGAGTVALGLHESARAGVLAAADAAQQLVLAGGSCEDAAVCAVRRMEEDEAFNAGRGACMTRAGTFELDAGIMRSRDLRSGAVASVPDVRDPIALARLVMERSKHHFLAAAGAVEFAREHGIGCFGRDEVWTDKAQARFDAAKAGRMSATGRADTVGAVVLDRDGHLCAACSTGGVLLKSPGRVGDTPVCGAGFYAHPDLGAATATGLGEAILTHVMSYEVLRRIAAGEAPQSAAAGLCHEVASQRAATAGVIVVTPSGRVAVAHQSQHMTWAIARGAEAPQCDLARSGP